MAIFVRPNWLKFMPKSDCAMGERKGMKTNGQKMDKEEEEREEGEEEARMKKR